MNTNTSQTTHDEPRHPWDAFLESHGLPPSELVALQLQWDDVPPEEKIHCAMEFFMDRLGSAANGTVLCEHLRQLEELVSCASGRGINWEQNDLLSLIWLREYAEDTFRIFRVAEPRERALACLLKCLPTPNAKGKMTTRVVSAVRARSIKTWVRRMRNVGVPPNGEELLKMATATHQVVNARLADRTRMGQGGNVHWVETMLAIHDAQERYLKYHVSRAEPPALPTRDRVLGWACPPISLGGWIAAAGQVMQLTFLELREAYRASVVTRR
jgi:hypothetical protein